MAFKHKKIWILVADRAKGKVFEWLQDTRGVHEILFMEESDARKPERELKAERAGQGQGFAGKIRYSVEDKAHYKEQASEAFLSELAQYLSTPDVLKAYDELVVIAAEDVYKLIRHRLSAGAAAKIGRHHAKNVTNMPASDLADYFVNKVA